MPLLDEPAVSGRADARPVPSDSTIDRTSEDATIDLTSEDARPPDPAAPATEASAGDREARPHRTTKEPARPLVAAGRAPSRGMCIRRVRLGSIAVLAAVFWTLGFLVTVGTLVALWNVAHALGVVTEIEDVLITSLGLEGFQIDGDGLFTVVSMGAASIAAIGWLLTVLLAAVYNATSAVFGGLAVETGPLERHERVVSLRRFFTIPT